MFEIQFAEKHMNRVHPSEVQVEQMTNEPVTYSNPGPWILCSWWIRALASKAIIVLALHLIEPHYID